MSHALLGPHLPSTASIAGHQLANQREGIKEENKRVTSAQELLQAVW
jgi:hypothetical protein